MGHALPLRQSWRCGGDLHTLVDLHGIRTDHLAAERFGKLHRQRRFPGGGRPNNGKNRYLMICRHHGIIPFQIKGLNAPSLLHPAELLFQLRLR